MAHVYFYIVIAIIALVFSGIAILIGMSGTRNRFYKYIPACISGIAAAGFFVKARFFAQGFEDLGYLIFAMIAGAVFLISLMTAVIMEYVGRKKS